MGKNRKKIIDSLKAKLRRKSKKILEEEIVETNDEESGHRYPITTPNGKRSMDTKYVVILDLIQENKGINIANLNTKLSEKGYGLNYKNILERIKKLEYDGYLNKPIRKRQQTLLIISKKGKKALEYYKDKLSYADKKSKLKEFTLAKGLKTFKIKVKCDNCGWKGELELKFGEKIQSAMEYKIKLQKGHKGSKKSYEDPSERTCECCGVKGKIYRLE